MPTEIHYVKNEDGGTRVPVTDGTYTTFDKPGSDISYQTEDGVFVIAFYDASDNVVTPTAGTITPEMSPISGQWQSPSDGDTTINATEVEVGLSSYTIPRFAGPAMQGRMTLAGITGASYCVAYFWRTS